MDISPTASGSLMCRFWRGGLGFKLITCPEKVVVGRRKNQSMRVNQDILIQSIVTSVCVPLSYDEVSDPLTRWDDCHRFYPYHSSRRFKPLTSSKFSNLAPFSRLSSAANGDTSISVQPRHTRSTRSAGVSESSGLESLGTNTKIYTASYPPADHRGKHQIA